MKHVKRFWIGFIATIALFFIGSGAFFMFQTFTPIFYLIGAILFCWLIGYVLEKIEGLPI